MKINVKEKNISNKYTYISLFSGAGVGCYGFKENGFECIATNELNLKRIDIQKVNNVCKYESGYISGDIANQDNQKILYREVEKWKENKRINSVDVVIATPPCQGMSTANYKKNNENKRNSLVVEAIKIIKNIKPRVFVFENVRAFLNTECTDIDGCNKTISDSISDNLSKEYNIYHKVINFKDYGIPSSRPRTIVIGTLKNQLNITPLNIFPVRQKEISLRKSIGHLRSLKYGEIDIDDVYHFSREYPKYMEEWINDLVGGESAFSKGCGKYPYKIVDDKKIVLRSGHLGNKFRRLLWDRPCACIATRNDQLASQDTIHPSDNRVLSIRELMILMTIPNSFKWTRSDDECILDKKNFLKKNELNIRRCIGEAVPTKIMSDIAKNIKDSLEFEDFLKVYKKKDAKKLAKNKILNKNFYINTFLEEELLVNAKDTGSFYTPQSVVFYSLKKYKPENKKTLKILEPSVGLGAFIPQLLRVVDGVDNVILDVVDISRKNIDILKKSLKLINISSNVKINFRVCDFLKLKLKPKSYDLIISNPPYGKPESNLLKNYRNDFNAKKSSNFFDFFMRKFVNISDEQILIIPKNFLMASEYQEIRSLYERFPIVSVNDFGVKYFKKVFVEIISIHFKNNYKDDLIVESLKEDKKIRHKQKYIIHRRAWLLYRDSWFDKYISSLKLNFFDFFRDRQISNKHLKGVGKIRVLKSKNILDSGEIISINGYDAYLDDIDNFTVKKYLNSQSIIMPNFTYNTRATYLPKNCIPNGSIAILKPKNFPVKEIDLNLYSSNDFRRYYAIIKNKSKFTLNIDSSSIYYIGIKKYDK